MSALSINPPFPVFPDLDGQPLEDGYIWIGTAAMNPISNPIVVYWDAALTIPAPQPIRTIGGFPARAGSPAMLYVNSDYSIQVQNKNGSVTYSAPNATGRYSDVVISTINASQVLYDPAGLGAVQTTVETKLRETVSVKDFGAVGNGATDDTAAIQNAIDYCISASAALYFNPGTYNVTRSVWPSSDWCLKISGGITIFGHDPKTTIIRTVKLNGTLPNGSDTSTYRGAFGVVNAAVGAEIQLENITLDGGNTSTTKSFNLSHKAVYFQTGTQIVSKFFVFNCAIKNFEGEGLHAPNGRVSQSEVLRTELRNCGGSMGNLSGSTKYFDCAFIQGSNCSIEHALDAYTGYLIVDNCSFFNGVKNKGNVIAVQNVFEPFTGTAAQILARTGTKFIVRNSVFNMESTWLTTTGTAPYYYSSIGPKCVGYTLVENNAFTNSTAGGNAYGMGTIICREWNDVFVIKNNTFLINDATFSLSNINITSSDNTQLKVIGNIAAGEVPYSTFNNIYTAGPTSKPDLFVSANNVSGNLAQIQFTASLTTVDGVALPVLKTYNVIIVMNIVNSAPTIINMARTSDVEIIKLIDETPAVGYTVRQVTFTAVRYNANEFVTSYRVRCSGDTANTFSIQFIDI